LAKFSFCTTASLASLTEFSICTNTNLASLAKFQIWQKETFVWDKFSFFAISTNLARYNSSKLHVFFSKKLTSLFTFTKLANLELNSNTSESCFKTKKIAKLVVARTCVCQICNFVIFVNMANCGWVFRTHQKIT
jgi:hypothetical protein